MIIYWAFCDGLRTSSLVKEKEKKQDGEENERGRDSREKGEGAVGGTQGNFWKKATEPDLKQRWYRLSVADLGEMLPFVTFTLPRRYRHKFKSGWAAAFFQNWYENNDTCTKSIQRHITVVPRLFTSHPHTYNNDLQMTLWVTQRCFHSFQTFRRSTPSSVK